MFFKKKFLILILSLSLFANEYENMSTQELIAIVGYVSPKDLKDFNKEMNNRKTFFTDSEWKLYKERLKATKSRRK